MISNLNSTNTALSTIESKVDASLPKSSALKVKQTYNSYSVTANTDKTITPADAGFSDYNTIYAALPFILAASNGNKAACQASSFNNYRDVLLCSPTTQNLYVVIYYLYV